MRLNRKVLALALVAPALVLLTGCGGIVASPSVSPATFLLPGILKADPPKPVLEPDQGLPLEALPTEPGCLVAQL